MIESYRHCARIVIENPSSLTNTVRLPVFRGACGLYGCNSGFGWHYAYERLEEKETFMEKPEYEVHRTALLMNLNVIDRQWDLVSTSLTMKAISDVANGMMLSLLPRKRLWLLGRWSSYVTEVLPRWIRLSLICCSARFLRSDATGLSRH